MEASPGLISATFHRSFDGTRMYNYGQWMSEEAFYNLEKQPGFSKQAPYWQGTGAQRVSPVQCRRGYRTSTRWAASRGWVLMNPMDDMSRTQRREAAP